MLNIDIAIIGMSGRFPGASNIDEFWSNINNKINSIAQFSDNELINAGVSPELIQNPGYVKVKGYLKNAEFFDAGFFKFSRHEAEILDPQYRLFFEATWEALENAGYVPDKYSGKIGIFAGSSNIDGYYLNNLRQNQNIGSTLLSDNFTVMLYNAKDFLSALLAYKLNLRGPAVTVQTACSTSLVAVTMACQSLLNFESDIALAGGTCVTMPLKSGYMFQDGMMLSPTGKCSTFDKDANGIVLGNGLGVIVLKRLSEALKDGDYIHAVIKGFSVNSDGSEKIGFTAPGILGQQVVVQDALKRANIQPEMISYIETHGTGTILGDLIEIEALTRVFKKQANDIALGSVKPNIGHLDAASGIAGLIKVVQALKYKILPPNIHFETPNPQINFQQTSFYINTVSAPWKSVASKYYAGVSSFGIGGTNVHIILTEAPQYTVKNNILKPVLLVLSARTIMTLNQMRKNLAIFLNNNHDINLANVAYTLQFGRKHFKYRIAYICSTIEEAINYLQKSETNILITSSNTEQEQLVPRQISFSRCL
jgi:acyl transferase domain-containing protein